MEYKIPVAIIFVLFCNFSGARSLICYECSDTFKTIWKPGDCQTNVSRVPTRICNPQQHYCLVKSVKVKGILTEFVRDCAEDCRYGCEATSFGITKMTCSSCCNDTRCNDGNEGQRLTPFFSPHYSLMAIAFQTLVGSFLPHITWRFIQE